MPHDGIPGPRRTPPILLMSPEIRRLIKRRPKSRKVRYRLSRRHATATHIRSRMKVAAGLTSLDEIVIAPPADDA